MTFTEFEQYEVIHRVQRKIRCLGCSRRMSRQRTFRAPLRDGASRLDIRHELIELSSRWHPRGVCAGCMATGDYVMLEDGNFALKFAAQGFAA